MISSVYDYWFFGFFLLCDIQKIGRAIPSINCQTQVVDKIHIFDLSKQGIFEKGITFYQSGWSLREIAMELGVSKSHVRQSFLDNGVDLRQCNKGLKKANSASVRRHTGVAPYGYCVIRGLLVPDPREQQNIQRIIGLWSSIKTYSGVASRLNSLKIKTRNGGPWDHSIVRSILNRHNIQKEKAK